MIRLLRDYPIYQLKVTLIDSKARYLAMFPGEEGQRSASFMTFFRL
jgi:hypothetical protein